MDDLRKRRFDWFGTLRNRWCAYPRTSASPTICCTAGGLSSAKRLSVPDTRVDVHETGRLNLLASWEPLSTHLIFAKKVGFQLLLSQ